MSQLSHTLTSSQSGIAEKKTGRRDGSTGGNHDPSQNVQADEISSLKRHFADENLESTEVRVLHEEGEHLSKLLKKAFPNDSRDTWTYADLDDAVQKSRHAWESKERIGHGKPQKLFHNLMRKFDAHSNLFQFIPSGNIYASVVTGATAILVKASVNHSKTIEELSDSLDAITEAVSISDVESSLIKSQAMQNAVAKLYIAIFLFFGDSVTWYTSSALSKVAHSLHRNFSERFRASIDKIKDLAANVRYVAQLGSQAEVRVVRLEVEALQDELQDVRVGMSGRFRQLAEYLHAQHGENMKQHEKTQELLFSYQAAGMLPAPPVAERDYQNLIRPTERLALTDIAPAIPPAAICDSESARSMPEPHSTTNREDSLTLADHMEFLVQLMTKDKIESQTTSSKAFDRPLVQAATKWLSNSESCLLYVEYLASISTEDTVIAFATSLIEACEGEDLNIVPLDVIPLLSLRQRFPDRKKRLSVFLIFLAYQIGLLNCGNSRPTSIEWQQAERPENIFLSDASRLLRNEIARSSLKSVHILIPGQLVFADIDDVIVRGVVDTLKIATESEGKTVKVLILTHLRLTNLLSLLTPDEIVLLRQQAGKNKTPKIPIVVPRAGSEL